MPKRALMPTDNLKHNVPALLKRAKASLTDLAKVDFLTEVTGQARGRIEAKKYDRERFLGFYRQL